MRESPLSDKHDVLQYLDDKSSSAVSVELARVREVLKTGLAVDKDTGQFEQITKLLVRLTQHPIAAVSIVGEDRQYFKDVQGLDISGTPRSESFCSHAIQREPEFYEIRDTAQDPRYKHHPLVIGPPYIRSYAGCPIYSPESFKLGTVCVIGSKPHGLDAHSRSVLTFCARTVETVIARRFEQATNGSMMSKLADVMQHTCHETKNLIGPAIGIVELLNLSMPAAAKQHRGILAMLKENVSRTIDMLQGVADMAIVTKNKIKTLPIATTTEEEEPDSNKMTTKLLSTRSWLERYVVLNKHVVIGAVDNCLVNVDPGLLHQVLSNLITNAQKYGTAERDIVLSCTLGKSQTVFRVKNIGPVIEEENRHKLFTEFGNHLSKAPHPDSRGIGLYVCKTIMQRLGGDIWLNEDWKYGCDFHFSVPNTAQKKTREKVTSPNSTLSNS